MLYWIDKIQFFCINNLTTFNTFPNVSGEILPLSMESGALWKIYKATIFHIFYWQRENCSRNVWRFNIFLRLNLYAVKYPTYIYSKFLYLISFNLRDLFFYSVIMITLLISIRIEYFIYRKDDFDISNVSFVLTLAKNL